MMMWFCIAHFITIDLFLICIDISGLTMIEWGNQLYITMIETLVLSLVGLVLGSYELYSLKDSLAYTET
jgi:Na+/H+ antiporter NhaB